MTDTAERLIAYCRENGRICPLPLKWAALWNLLPERRRVGSGYEPSMPLILAEWHPTSDEQKMARVAEHIKWAERHGGLAAVAGFLRDLAEADWYHVGD